MKKFVVAAGLALTLFSAAILPASAQDSNWGHGIHGQGRGGGAPPPSEMGAAGIISMALGLDLTPEQQVLLDALQEKSREMRATFPRLGGPDPERGIVDRMRERVDIMRRQADALETLIPAAEAFMRSLTPEQIDRMESFRPRPGPAGAADGTGSGAGTPAEAPPPPRN